MVFHLSKIPNYKKNNGKKICANKFSSLPVALESFEKARKKQQLIRNTQ